MICSKINKKINRVYKLSNKNDLFYNVNSNIQYFQIKINLQNNQNLPFS